MDYRSMIEEAGWPRGPMFSGTPLAISDVLRELARGVPEGDLLRQHPQLRSEHVKAALLYAADHLMRKAA
jgi:uncharacterized protein (DUF433 family)